MTKTDSELIAELSGVLARQKFSPVVVGNYCSYARGHGTCGNTGWRDVDIARPVAALRSR